MSDAYVSYPKLGYAEVGPNLNPGPNAYAVAIDGDCLAPTFNPLDIVVCDPDVRPEAGDFVSIWWKDESKEPGIKRLAMALPPEEIWESEDFTGLLVCETLNPRKRFTVDLSRVKAVHKVLGATGQRMEGRS